MDELPGPGRLRAHLLAPQRSPTTRSCYGDQDVLNAILSSDARRPSALDALERRLAPIAAVRRPAGRSTRRPCAARYGDGLEPYLLHHYIRQALARADLDGVYSRLLRRLLLGDDVAVRVPERALPRHLRGGYLARAMRRRGQRPRAASTPTSASRSSTGIARPATGGPADRWRSRRSPPPSTASPTSATSSARSAWSTRCAWSATTSRSSCSTAGSPTPSASCSQPTSRSSPTDSDTPPWLLKTVAPLAHPAEVMVLIDADMIVTRPLDELIERARDGQDGRGRERPRPLLSRVGRAARPRRRCAASPTSLGAGGRATRELGTRGAAS